MVSSYNTTTQNLAVDDTLTFTTNRVRTGCSVSHTPGAAEFILHRPGYYYVAFNGYGATAGVAGDVVATLLSDGTAVPGAEASGYSGAAAEGVSLSFSTIIKVLPSCNCVDNAVTLTVQNTGVASTFETANLVITKLG